ncbi:MAG TPA: hypothetical protein VKT54_03715 [Steroidobacteraceae bacterium]|nr:hypothetical protein [Steroidobacteraceae bacterium]
MKLHSVRVAAVAALLSVALAGCIVAPGPGYYGETVYTEPPAVQYESVGVAPYPGYFWIGGSWFWEGGRYGWHPGHWEAPRAGYRWEPRRWERTRGGWHAREGHWERR